ncbi:hypothetical protein [Mycobacterium sp.]|uniref:hypothetical protein n=1 Tax=Mycobacterium sp. TaxID=1785 RepID=UPI0031DB6649
MSQSKFTGLGIGAAMAGAAVAAFVGMGTASADIVSPFADPYAAPDPYDVLFGAQGAQGIANSNLDASALTSNPTSYDTFAQDVGAFESTASEHGLENLVNAIDPSAFYEQTGGLGVNSVTNAAFEGTIGSADAYLAPDSALGYLATGLDYGLLTPTGLDFVLTPLIDILTGTPFA